MDKFLSNHTNSTSSTTSTTSSSRKMSINLTDYTGKTLIDSALEGVCDDKRMEILQNLQKLMQESVSYLNELMKAESKRLVVDLRCVRFI